MEHSLPLPRRRARPATRRFVTPGTSVGFAMASVGTLLAIAIVWLEEQQALEFAVGVTIGIALLPWILAFLPSAARLIPQPGGVCAIALGSGVLVGMAGLYSGRTIPFLIGAALALVAMTVWTVASHTGANGYRQG